jgi:hypothetical protein
VDFDIGTFYRGASSTTTTMRPLSRLRPSIEAVISYNNQLPYICRSCRVRAVAPRRHASIMSLFRRTKPDDNTESTTVIQSRTGDGDRDASFIPASTWDGLEWIGTREWQAKRNVVDGHNFERYLLLSMYIQLLHC